MVQAKFFIKVDSTCESVSYECFAKNERKQICKKKIENESTQYAFVNATPATTTPDTTYGGDFKKFIHLSLTISDIQQDLNPNYPDTRFVFGYAHDKEIYSLEVEGQKPDGVIEINVYDRTMYLWYYDDLKSDKRGNNLSYSVDMPE